MIHISQEESSPILQKVLSLSANSMVAVLRQSAKFNYDGIAVFVFLLNSGVVFLVSCLLLAGPMTNMNPQFQGQQHPFASQGKAGYNMPAMQGMGHYSRERVMPPYRTSNV